MSMDGGTWTSGLVPGISPDTFSEILSRTLDLGIVIATDGTVIGVLANPAFRPKNVLARFEGKPLADTLTTESIAKFNARLAEFLTAGPGDPRA